MAEWRRPFGAAHAARVLKMLTHVFIWPKWIDK